MATSYSTKTSMSLWNLLPRELVRQMSSAMFKQVSALYREPELANTTNAFAGEEKAASFTPAQHRTAGLRRERWTKDRVLKVHCQPFPVLKHFPRPFLSDGLDG